MDSLRDWGHARDYVEMQWLMLQQAVADDFVIATGKQASVRDFVHLSARELGITLAFEGSGLEEVGRVAAIDNAVADDGICVKPGDIMVAVDSKYYRPAEVETLLGDPSKARIKLAWEPETTMEEMIVEMVANDLSQAKKHRLLLDSGYDVSTPGE
jgi:GDPmannose 4,6-dehydratase